MQARCLSAGPVIAASIAAGMPLGSEGNAQPTSGACAIALPASAPARILGENSVLSIFSLVNSRHCRRRGPLAAWTTCRCVHPYQISLRREALAANGNHYIQA